MIVKCKPKELLALQWDGGNEEEILKFLQDLTESWNMVKKDAFNTLHLKITDQHIDRYYQIRPRNWLIKDHEGKLQVCPDAKFLSNYEIVKNQTQTE